MSYWLVKSEPETYSWGDFVTKGRDHWDGVRNYAARNHMRAMKSGDAVLFYHSGKEKQIVGVATVVKEHYQDPTTEDERWSVVDFEPVHALQSFVTLKEIKADVRFEDMILLKQSRLSVQPVSDVHFDLIMKMSERTD